MGLDITYYRNVVKADDVIVTSSGDLVSKETMQELGWENDIDFVAYVNDDFPGRNGSIEDRAAYRVEGGGGFRAGSYGWYNAWRDELARISGWPLGSYEQYGHSWDSYAASAGKVTEGPFWELIYFSDCEGIIGPEVSRKLADDFAAYDEKAKASEVPFFYDKYKEWRKAFETAAEGGCVRFH